MRFIAMTIAGMSLALAGCSTDTRITSEPPGALVYINQVPRGTTPLRVELEWWNWTPPYQIRLEKAGFKTIDAPMEKHIYTGHMVCDIFFCFPLLWVNTNGPPESMNFALPPIQQ